MDKNIGKKLDGRYELLELIGVGGMADIYRAKDITEDKTVAVKILKNELAGSEDFLRRFRNESKAIALLSHPNIVKIFDVGFTEKVQFIVMEYIDGITLTEYIERQGVLKWRDAVHFTVQILRALQHAHDRGIVHRDIKSQNVMLLADGTIKVMDFGIARFNRETDKTISEKAIGSVHYISPEQAKGEMTDEKSDIYSVGVMLYEMLTGAKPFDGDSPVSIALMHMQATPKKPTEINGSIPEGLEEITVKAMQKQPDKRYQTAGEMIKDIEEFKKNPSIVFEYKYFSTDGTNKFFDSPKKADAERQKPAPQKRKPAQEEYDDYPENDDEDYDDYDDEDYDVAERRSPLLPILFAVASVFVILSAWLIFELVTNDETGITAIVDQGGEKVTMPKLVGEQWDTILEKYGDYNIKAIQEYSSEYPKGEVFDQSVNPGREIKKNQEVTVKVSSGPKLVEVDDYSDKHMDEVEILLDKQGLGCQFVFVEDDQMAANYIIRTEPAAREVVQTGTVVTCYVSIGGGDVLTAVPKMINLSLTSAEARAKEYEIVLSIVYEPSTEVEKDHVISQSIEPLEKVEKNTVVEIVVSNGEIPVRESTISISLGKSSKGNFIFRYYIDGTLQEDMTETKNVELADKIKWEISGSEVSEYAIEVESVDTGAKAMWFRMTVDFTTDPPTKDDNGTFNKNIFKELLAADPAETTTSNWDESLWTDNVWDTTTSQTDDIPVINEEQPSENIPEDDEDNEISITE